MSKAHKELRMTARAVEMRSGEDGKKLTAIGYAAVFDDGTPGTRYEYYDFREVISPSAFNRALRDRQDVRGLFNHDSNQLLGRVSSSTLRLSVDSVGLRYEIDLPDTGSGRDVAELLRRGDLAGSSFQFRVKAESFKRLDNDPSGCKYQRTIDDVDLIDVGPVTFPAYEGTSAAMRSEDIEQLRSEAEANLRKAEANSSPSDEEKRESEALAELVKRHEALKKE